MLYTRTLNAGEWDTLSVRGKHINLVLAAGTIRLSLLTLSGQSFATNIVAGMSPEDIPEFSQIQFKSDTAQTIQYWAGTFPLTFAPDTSRQVGSSAVSSSVGQVFSGTPELLLAAVTGRNRVTLAPTADILIGGVGLNPKNGIPIAAGEVRELATQGELYGLDLSGAYFPTVGVALTQTDVNERREESTDLNNRGFITRTVGGVDQVIVNAGSASWRLYDVLNAGFADLGLAGNFGEPRGYYAKAYGDSFIFTSAAGVNTKIVEVDTQGLTVVNDDTIAGSNFAEHFDCYDNLIAVYASNRKLFTKLDGSTWVEGTTLNPQTGTPYGVAINSSGHIYVLHVGAIAWTTDKGATWNTITLPSNAQGERGIAIDTVTDDIYYCSVLGLQRSSDNGVSWTLDFSMTSPNTVVAQGGTIAVSNTGNFALKTGDFNSSVILNNNGTSRGANVGDDGRVYINHNDALTIVEGRRALAGGIEVAIMAELN